MKQTGILMRPELAERTRKGTKTMTRRVLKVQPGFAVAVPHTERWVLENGYYHRYVTTPRHGEVGAEYFKCPYGVPGDQLYVKEPFQIERFHEWPPTGQMAFEVNFKDGQKLILPCEEREYQLWSKWKDRFGWKSPFFMFKSVARTWMEITAVGAQRIQDISRDDAFREGVTPVNKYYEGNGGDYYKDTLGPFQYLWDSINSAKDNAWSLNKWQWVITYKLIEKP